jgi:hypothetical protein
VETRNVSRIMIITTVIATFVIYLCAAVSKILPFILAVGLTVFMAACALTKLTSFAEIIRLTQKRE